MNICVCGKETKNPKYCSRSCAAKETNKIPKRKRNDYVCKVCGIEVPYKRTTCDKHNQNVVDWSTVTYDECTGIRGYQKNSRIRSLARVQYTEEMNGIKCEKCNDYDKHLEIHHIKEISDFDGSTMVLTINERSNIQFLCPNCHWEVHNL